jgi:hypothetical protein
MSITARIIIGLCALVVAVGVYFAFIPRSAVVTVESGILPGPITIEGEMICLPHADDREIQTLECAFGVKDSEGRTIALRDSDPEYKNISSVPFNTRVRIDGVFEKTIDSKYQSVGTILVSKVSRVVPVLNSYRSATYGIAFTYPEGYVLAESEAGNAERAHHSISITKATNVPAPTAGEGPVSVTIDIYQNDLDRLSLIAWITNTSESNFKLGPGVMASTTVAGVEAASYTWSGLYEGESTVFLHGTNVVSVSGTHMDATDEMRDVYRSVLASVSIF